MLEGEGLPSPWAAPGPHRCGSRWSTWSWGSWRARSRPSGDTWNGKSGNWLTGPPTRFPLHLPERTSILTGTSVTSPTWCSGGGDTKRAPWVQAHGLGEGLILGRKALAIQLPGLFHCQGGTARAQEARPHPKGQPQNWRLGLASQAYICVWPYFSGRSMGLGDTQTWAAPGSPGEHVKMWIAGSTLQSLGHQVSGRAQEHAFLTNCIGKLMFWGSWHSEND